MFKRRLTISEILLIVVNLIPLYGVWFEGWDPRMIFLVYCLETMIIGIVNVLKMAIVTLLMKPTEQWNNNGRVSRVSGWFFIFFFIVHYGMFVLIQTQLFFGASGLVNDTSFFGAYRHIPGWLGPDGKMLLLIFVLYYSLQTFFEFFQSGDYKNITLTRLLFQPYGRIVIQQLIVILGSMFLSFGAGKIFMLVMVAIKLFFELYVNLDRYLRLAERMNKKETGASGE
ncbi:MAG: DUF6498-containing protein [Ferruginibacter sp.]